MRGAHMAQDLGGSYMQLYVVSARYDYETDNSTSFLVIHSYDMNS